MKQILLFFGVLLSLHGFSQIDSAIHITTKNGIRIPLKTELENDSMFDKRAYFKDLNNDGTEELIYYYYTGGPHCCQWFRIYNRVGEKEYTFADDLVDKFATLENDTVIVDDKGLIRGTLIEHLGYFHTCFMCDVETKRTVVDYLYFRYENKKLTYASVPELNDSIEYSLQELTTKPVKQQDTADFGDFDDGIRKAFAMNITAFYYNNKQDKEKTKALFFKYYKAYDSDLIWKEFSE
jgi:hypothetical protein